MSKKEQAAPPKWINKILSSLIHSEYQEEILGDLKERFDLRVASKGVKKARLAYLREAISFIRPKTVSGGRYRRLLLTDMFFSNFKLSFRNIRKGGTFSTINIFGLVLGLSTFAIISLWIKAERAVDNFHENGARLYALYYAMTTPDNREIAGYEIPFEFISPEWDRDVELEKELLEKIPGVEHAVSYKTGYELPWGYPCTFRYQDVRHKFSGSIASPSFFKMFSFGLLHGDPETALLGRKSLSISRKMAELFYGSTEEAIGKTIRYENLFDLQITGVFEDVPSNSTLQFDYLINWEIFQKESGIVYSSNLSSTFIQLDQNSDLSSVEEQIRHHLDERLVPLGITEFELGILPYKDRYLYSEFENGTPATGRIEYLRIFRGISLFIFIVALVNFLNLSAAQSIKRAKEVGMRKILGSSKRYVILLFVTEGLMLAFFSSLIVLTAINVLSPYFEQLSGREFWQTWNLDVFANLFWLTLLAGLLGGLYPALLLSSWKPVKVLKGKPMTSRKSILLTKSLVVVQFSISILLLIVTIVVSRQSDFLRNAPLGYDRENIIYVDVEGTVNENYHVIKQQLLDLPGIQMVDRSSEAPHAMDFEMIDPFKWQGQEENQLVGFYPTSVGFDFMEMLDLKVVEGRAFSKAHPSDTMAFLVNETAVDEMGMQDPVGKWISAWGKKGKIIGVLKDYHINSMHKPIRPLIVDIKEDITFGKIMIKTYPSQTKQALESIESVFSALNPEFPFEYTFLDHEYNALYKHEVLVSRLSNHFSILATIISCLGLLGLAIFSAEKRTKELGIRKALGASISGIVALFSSDFMKLVLASTFIAIPIAFLALNRWLEGFAYRIELEWWLFALCALLALVVAFLTISLQALKSAKVNPAQILRSE